MNKIPIIVGLVLGLFSCKKSAENSPFEKLDASQTGVDFVNKLVEDEQNNVLNYEYFYNGGGVAAADLNNDGLPELFFTGNQVPCKLYLNKGQLKFEDITATALPAATPGSWHTGVTVVDINADGWLDIFVASSSNVHQPQLRHNKLYINQGVGVGKSPKFAEKAAEYGLNTQSYCTQASFFDYDRDGDLDCYLLNHNVKDFKRFDVAAVRFMRDSLAGDCLLRNNGPVSKFEDVSIKAGIKGNPIGFGLGLHTADLNADGLTDIYVSNDYLEEDYLYINHGDGTFTDEIKQRTTYNSYFSMGNEVADLNNDLQPDIFTTDMLPEDNKRQKLLFGPDKYEAYLNMLKNDVHKSFMRNMLQLNNGNGSFAEVGQLAGISNTDWSWSPIAADFDLDGQKDLFVTNGYMRDYTNNDFVKFYADAQSKTGMKIMDIIERMPSTNTANYIFRNKGEAMFENMQKAWGFTDEILSQGAVAADLDADGDLEIVSNNLNNPASIYKNLSAGNQAANYLKIELPQGQQIGTKLLVYFGKNTQYQEFTPNHGFQSANYTSPVFGLGKAQKADSIRVVWPDGSSQLYQNIKANQSFKAAYNAIQAKPYIYPKIKPIFDEKVIDISHNQMPLNDFSRQLLLPQMYSYAGPRMAVGDVNGDKLDDFFLCGGKGQAGQLMLQKLDGSFTKTSQPDIDAEAIFTDTDAKFSDIDRDGDLDLMVAGGGYEYLPTDLALQNRVYNNDGRGHFTKNWEALDDLPMADNVLQLIDYDRDGDDDLLVGGGCIPQQYPNANPSRLYRNDKGKFIKTEQPAIANLGLLNDAAILDINQDQYPDIVAVGEWTGIQFLQNDKKGGFQKLDNEWLTLTGFWQRIKAVDIDNDRDLDLVIGNFGLNNQWKASATEPLNLHLADFDRNNSPDPIMSYYIQGKNYPAYSRDELLDQLVPLKKKYTNYESYSTATTDDILAEFKDVVPEKKEINTLETILLVNEKGVFKKITLPIQAQYAPVKAIASTDINADGYPDLILAGNELHTRVRLGTLEANWGQVFINNKKGGFYYLPQSQSGLNLRNQVTDIQNINKQLLVATNSQKMRRFSTNIPKSPTKNP
jgi:enediyne biosynthesis protein E4